VLYIALSYLGQGFAQHFCLLSQPLDNFFLKSCRWSAAEVASYMALLMVPWTLKPVFGFLVDFFPLPGSSKRFYLTASFSIAALCYAATVPLGGFGFSLTVLLFISSAALACASATLLGLVVQKFKGASVSYVIAWQNFMYYAALMGAGLLAGRLCQTPLPFQAVQTATLISSCVCGVLAVISFFFVQEFSTPRQPMTLFASRFRAVCANKAFFLAALFVFCWSFSPGFGTPLYFHYTNVLHLKQEFIGQANGINSVGMLAGAVLYASLRRLLPTMQMRISILAAVLSTSLFVIVTPKSVLALEFCHGVTSMLGALSASAIIASVSPPAMETLASALLIGVYNLGTQSGGVVGASLYTHVFACRLSPLLLVSAAATFGCYILAPVLEVSAVRNRGVFLDNDSNLSENGFVSQRSTKC
jgi:hypothetical protein